MNIYPDKLSKDYSNKRKNYTATDAEVFSQLNKIGLVNKVILDHGCGNGDYSFKFLSNGIRSIVGIDNSPVMIKLAKQKLKENPNTKISFIEADGVSLPFSDNKFDLVFSNFVLHHISDIKTSFAEIYRVLKHGGHFVATMNTYIIEADWEKLASSEIPIKLGSEYDSVKVTNFINKFSDIGNLILKTGFKVITYKSIENPDANIDEHYPYIKYLEKVTSLIVCKK